MFKLWPFKFGLRKFFASSERSFGTGACLLVNLAFVTNLGSKFVFCFFNARQWWDVVVIANKFWSKLNSEMIFSIKTIDLSSGASIVKCRK